MHSGTGRLVLRLVILHLTLGEGGNPKLSPAAYAEQKRPSARWPT
ncbi:MAG TPA: hypothetical protein VMX54_18035 [Vicinamibacteria bacterium]|nr:hypothetical protein [Vicinamibacteria bacterium]